MCVPVPVQWWVNPALINHLLLIKMVLGSEYTSCADVGGVPPHAFSLNFIGQVKDLQWPVNTMYMYA